jgi:hypothetical protein
MAAFASRHRVLISQLSQQHAVQNKGSYWHLASEIDVSSDVGDWGYTGRVADIGRPSRLTQSGRMKVLPTLECERLGVGR